MYERAGRDVEVAQLPEVYCERSGVGSSDWGKPLNRFETVQFSFVSFNVLSFSGLLGIGIPATVARAKRVCERKRTLSIFK